MNKVYFILLFLGAILLFGVYKFAFAPAGSVDQVKVDKADNIENPPTASISFVGDMMFDRYIRAKNSDAGYTKVLSAELIASLNKDDLVIANLEGPITSFESVSRYDIGDADHFKFTFDPGVINLLKLANIKAVSIGNNHILNFGSEGLQETKNNLGQNNLGFFGDPYDRDNVWEKEINGITFAFIAENEFDAIEPQETASIIQQYDLLVDHVIVVAHWGNEYETGFSPSQQEQARLFIDNGADLIIGSHPHVIQPIETYKEKLIYYSLGNFIFDQYFSDDVKCGLVANITFTKDSITKEDESYIQLIEDGTTAQGDKCSAVI